MSSELTLRRILVSIALGINIAVADAASDISLLALFGDKVLLHINGERRMLAQGETSPEGVKLIQSGADFAEIELNGKREELGLGLMATFPGSDDATQAPTWDGPVTVSLWADKSGFFYANGAVNGYPLRFLVDTGATSIAMNHQTAQRIGLNLNKAKRGFAQTASGVAPMLQVTLDRVNIGDITLNNVEAGVLMGNHPEVPLLGMSFLGQLDMVRENDRMDLKRRY